MTPRPGGPAPASAPLPIDALRRPLLEAAAAGPVVVTAPTGSGKSTQVPRWLAAAGRVLVVEPRRVACRGLAARVAELEGAELGRGVGYWVRDERRARADSRVVFATPGVVLRWLAAGPLDGFDAVVLDEFHERGLDTDLLLALLAPRLPRGLVVMSATLQAEALARHLGAERLEAAGRVFPVAVTHHPGGAFLPDPRGLAERVAAALDAAADHPGDMLVFLPGKGEIAAVQGALARRREWEVLPLHGGLTLAEQGRVFRPAERRRVVLATNVAETSLTIPGIGVVLDSGLVRRTRYHSGRGFLTLGPIALDSAAQRAGRAGRTAPGVCLRLWDPAAILAEHTPPALHREALDPLVLAAAACGERLEELAFFDPPKAYAVQAARDNLAALGAVDPGGAITPRGRRLFGLPLDAPLGALLVEAEARGCLDDAVDLVAALAGGRPLFRRDAGDAEEDLRAAGCDAVALIAAVRRGHPGRHGLHPGALDEARALRRRLRRAWDLPEPGPGGGGVDRRRLALTALAADPRSAYVARRRRNSVAWSNGGTEVELARESAVDPTATVAVVALETRALGTDQRRTRVEITCAMPVPPAWLVAAGLGETAVGRVAVRGGAVQARVETCYAGRVLEARDQVPEGPHARAAVLTLLAEGRLFPDAVAELRERLEAARLLAQARALQAVPAAVAAACELEGFRAPEGDWEQWLAARLDALGLESGADLPLLAADDLLPPPLPAAAAAWLDATYPRRLALGDATYAVAYDLARRRATLTKVAGYRKLPPSAAMLPRLQGLRVTVRHGNQQWQLR